MADLPIMLRLTGAMCVVLGAGSVAVRRIKVLLAAGAQVRVIAPEVSADVASLPVTCEVRRYQPGDLTGARLVVVATNDPTVNAAASDEARRQGVLVNRADDPDAGDVTIPAHAHHGPVTLAVYTSGISASASAAIRRELSDALHPDWPRLLEAVAPYRRQLQEAIPDADDRRRRLRRLTDQRAMRILKVQGDEALRRHCEVIVRGEP